MITFRKIGYDNLKEITALTVEESQKSFVATNTRSLLEAYIALSEGNVALPFGVYADGVPVGFVMFGYGDADGPKVAAGNYCIWRFMIDERYQKRGYGRAALNKAIDYVRTAPCGKAEYCWLSYEPENTVAKKLYASAGFQETGEISGGEIVAALKL